MPNDAISISVDKIKFKWPGGKKMRVYAVAVVADNLGKVMITEPRASKPIRHRPKQGQPAVWDFVGDGYDVYHRLGGLPDFIKGSLMIIRDHAATRKAGEIVQAIRADNSAKSLIDAAAAKVPIVGPMGVIGVAIDVIGSILSKKKDKVIEVVDGSLRLTPERREMNELTEIYQGSDMDIELDAMLWDAAADDDSTADVSAAIAGLDAEGLLFTNKPGN